MMSSSSSAEASVRDLLRDAGISRSTRTRSGWCLQEGMTHVVQADNGSLKALVQRNGLPAMYSSLVPSSKECRHELPTEAETTTTQMKDPSTAFQSLCRIIVGQQLGGAAAHAAWKRLNATCEENVCPEQVAEKAALGLQEHLQKPAGISLAKAKSLTDLALRFQDKTLSEESLSSATTTDDGVRQQLLAVKGLGPWSCDMFLMFYLERPNVLPLGDLGVRKGLARHFRLKGKAKGSSLCPKRDQELMIQVAKPFDGFYSLLAYYMWKAADTPEFYRRSQSPVAKKEGRTEKNEIDQPPKGETSHKRSPNTVTPEPRSKRSRRSSR